MEKTTKMVEEITRKRKMTEEVKQKLYQRIFYNCLVAIGVMLYICAIDVVYIYAKKEIVTTVLKVFAMIFIILTVGIFEIAYRKDNGRIAIVGIELLLFSVFILYVPKIYGNLFKPICRVFMMMPIYCGIYYMAKSIVIYLQTEKEYQNNLSDVKEIVKEEVEK